MKPEKLWGERFETLPSSEVIDFLSGRDVRAIPPCDERLIPYDLWVSRAHVLMLCEQSIISKRDAQKILRGLREVEGLHREKRFKLDPAKEDVHTNIESFVIERVGTQMRIDLVGVRGDSRDPARFAQVVAKALKSAVANAENNLELDPDELVVARAYVDKGPSVKRLRPRARGRADVIMKRSSHVTVVVAEKSR